MTRKREYKSEADILYVGLFKDIQKPAFIDGAKWADKTMIDKACKWIEDYLFELGFPDDWLRDSPNIMNGEQRFRKAMKE